MKLITAILIILFSVLNCHGQTNKTLYDSDLSMSSQEFGYIKKVMKEDIINWCNKKDKKLTSMVWKMMILRDTTIPILIKTNSGNFEIDLVEEFNRRMTGGFAGSYPFVEFWKFNVSEKKLIQFIKELKVEIPDLQIPGDTNLTSGRSSYWFYINFYDKVRNEKILTWTRPSTLSTSTFALISYRKFSVNHKTEQKRKLINKDFWKIENDQRIKRFENQVVDKIRNKINAEKRKDQLKQFQED